MKIASPILAACLFALLGCSPPAAPADPEKARTALRAALEAWAEGEKMDSLLGRSPAIHVADEDWQKGWTLKKFDIAAQDEQLGQQRRIGVKLSLNSPQGKAVDKQVRYEIDTSPKLVIVRTFE